MRNKAIALALLALCSSSAALAAGNPWKVTEAAGQVQIQHGSTATAASRGAVLAPRDVVQTGANGRAVIARGSDVVFVSPRTRLTIAPEEQARGLIQIIQDLGRATFMIERKANPHFAVGTPYLATVVKGTVFTIIVDSAGASVLVREGRVEVSTPRGETRQMVVTGMSASVSAASPERIDLKAGSDRDSGQAPGPNAPAGPEGTADRVSETSGSRAPTLDYVLAFMAGEEDEPAAAPEPPSANDLDIAGPDSSMPGGVVPEPILASAIAPLIPALPSAPAPLPPPPPLVTPPPPPAPAPVPPPPPAIVPVPVPPPPPLAVPVPPPPPLPVPAPAAPPPPPPPAPAPVPPPPPAPAPVPPPPPAPAPVPPPPPAPAPVPPPPPAPAPVPPPPPPPPPPGGICLLGLICV